MADGDGVGKVVDDKSRSESVTLEQRQIDGGED